MNPYFSKIGTQPPAYQDIPSTYKPTYYLNTSLMVSVQVWSHWHVIKLLESSNGFCASWCVFVGEWTFLQWCCCNDCQLRKTINRLRNVNSSKLCSFCNHPLLRCLLRLTWACFDTATALCWNYLSNFSRLLFVATSRDLRAVTKEVVGRWFAGTCRLRLYRDGVFWLRASW